MNFEIESIFEQALDRWYITLGGEIDIYNSDGLKASVCELLEDKPGNLYFELGNLSYIDSTGLGTFVSLLKRAKTLNKSVTLANVKPNVLKLFKITELDKVFQIESSEG